MNQATVGGAEELLWRAWPSMSTNSKFSDTNKEDTSVLLGHGKVTLLPGTGL